MNVKQSYVLDRQTTVDIYLYSDQFLKRESMFDNEIATISNLRYMPMFDFNVSNLKGKKIISGKAKGIKSSVAFLNAKGILPCSERRVPIPMGL